MPDSDESFTLDEVERRRILGSPEPADRADHLTPIRSSPEKRSRPLARSLNSTLGGVSNTPIFEYSYTQNFTQTQEDTSSFRQQIDEAPPEERSLQQIDNIFDDDDAVPEPFLPGVTSTAIQGPKDLRDESSFSAPSPIEDVERGLQEDTGGMANISKIAQTPALVRSRTAETPIGLTQMFQSSQETPVLQSRKSTYVSMKESQAGRLSDHDGDDSGDDEDPDFTRIRRSNSRVVRSSAAHSIMNRLRERAQTSCDDRDDATAHKGSSQDQRMPLDADEEESFENAVIPASAPVRSHLDSIPQGVQGGSDSIITDSQPQNSIAQTRPAVQTSDVTRGSSQLNETIHFNLPSSFSDGALGDTTNISKVDCIEKSPSPAISVISDNGREASPVPVASVVDTRECSPDLARGPVDEQFPVPDPVLQTGERQKPILLKDTPLSHSYDLTMTEPRNISSPSVRRSASYSVSSAVTPAQTSIQKSGRSRSVHLPYDAPPSSILPAFSSPVILAGTRRKSRRVPVIQESPVVPKTVASPRKRALVLSSLGEEEEEAASLRQQRVADHPRKRFKVAGEVHDSQATRKSRVVDSNPQTAFQLHLQADHGSEMSRSASEGNSSRAMASSPLTSLASEDFVQDTSPNHFGKPGTTMWSRRVLALHRRTSSYYPGELTDTLSTVDKFTEDTIVAINFDDGDQCEIEVLHVRPLDLRLGDAVKVNVPGIKSKQLIITSLHKDPQNGTLFTDIHGHTSFEARRKDQGSISHYNVAQIYIPQNLMKPFFKRQFSALGKSSAMSDIPTTPSRRQAVRNRDMSPTLSYRGSQPPLPKATGIFSGIGFTVTISNAKSASRDKLERKIVAHGGQLLRDGLDQLFEANPFIEDDIAPLRLTHSANQLTSAVVIADNPSRKAKYLQALSLGLPCLHYSYLDDCLTSRKLLDFSSYLLAAGEGTIHGTPVTLSMTCTTQSLRDATLESLSAVLSKRRKLWRGKKVIIVTGSDDLRPLRKIHLFLAWGMGCEEMTECQTIEEAHHIMMKPEDGKKWDLVSVQEVPGREKRGVGGGGCVLEQSGGGSGGIWVNGQGREEVGEWLQDLKGKVVTNEDVVQSLITGRFCVSY